jgi:adenosylhomocysteinase
MRDGAIMANSGHFDVEIDVSGLTAIAASRREVRPNAEEYTLADGRRIVLLAQGRLVNLGAAEGHPAAVMDMSFANQALVVEWLASRAQLDVAVHDVPIELDARVAGLKLASMGWEIDELSPAQRAYLASYNVGT